VKEHAAAIASARPGVPQELNDRAGDIWEPLFVLADLAGGDWPEKARRAACALSSSAQERSPIGSLLLDIFVVFTVSDVDRIFTRDLLLRLNAKQGRPWQEIRNGKEMTDVALGRLLRKYGVSSRTIWIADACAKGYLREDLLGVCRRYVTKADMALLKEECADGKTSKSQPPTSRESGNFNSE
jgi:uncharacterized protein DUF3631